MKPEILYEDRYLLALSKPSGMVVNRGFAQGDETLQDWIDNNFDFAIAHDDQLRNGIVHRLDKETSGVILVAKTEGVFYALQAQFKDRQTEKTYVALLHGEVKEKEGLINAPTGRLPKNRRKFGVVEGGREASTEYQNIGISEYQGEKYTLVEFKPKTGRTHQIRVHAKSLGHPIVSDYMYAGRKTTRRDRKWCPRLFLHAASIVFKHPFTNRIMTVEAPVAEDLKNVLLTLEKLG